MVWAGREVRSRTDYILGTDRRLFCNLFVQYTSHNSDYYLVLGCLCGAPLREKSKYLRRREWLPLRPSTTPEREDGLFAALRRDVLEPKAREAWKNA